MVSSGSNYRVTGGVQMNDIKRNQRYINILILECALRQKRMRQRIAAREQQEVCRVQTCSGVSYKQAAGRIERLRIPVFTKGETLAIGEKACGCWKNP